MLQNRNKQISCKHELVIAGRTAHDLPSVGWFCGRGSLFFKLFGYSWQNPMITRLWRCWNMARIPETARKVTKPIHRSIPWSMSPSTLWRLALVDRPTLSFSANSENSLRLSSGSLQGNEWLVYELVVRHFLACVSWDAKGQETRIKVCLGCPLPFLGRLFYRRYRQSPCFSPIQHWAPSYWTIPPSLHIFSGDHYAATRCVHQTTCQLAIPVVSFGLLLEKAEIRLFVAFR